jgi:hypothetical protein
MKRTKLVFAFLCFAGLGCACLVSCAGQRQEVVCDEIEYRYNSMSYSPDQRVFMEEELRACREEEAKKKQASAETRKSIYERFASQDTTKKVHSETDSIPAVSSAASDSAAVPTDSSTAAPVDSTAVPADSAAAPADSAAAATDSTVTDSSATEATATGEVAQ